MSNSVIIFIVYISILAILISEALSIFIVKEKGQKLYIGILLGFLPLIGHVIASLLKATDVKIVEEMYERDIMKKDDYDKTMETLIK